MSITYSIEERIRWSDIDIAGLIRWDAYARLVELAETELLREAGFPFGTLYDTLEIWLPRVQFHIDYRSPVRLDETLKTEIWVGKLGRSSIRLEFAMRNAQGALSAEGHLVIVALGRRNAKPVEVPAPLRHALLPYRKEP
ncbi:MAG TPA: thioesterase family protein [Burkholderiales bacterium]|nr:thioesterase family protein [Burkholderiales bacterium]